MKSLKPRIHFLFLKKKNREIRHYINIIIPGIGKTGNSHDASFFYQDLSVSTYVVISKAWRHKHLIKYKGHTHGVPGGPSFGNYLNFFPLS